MIDNLLNMILRSSLNAWSAKSIQVLQKSTPTLEAWPVGRINSLVMYLTFRTEELGRKAEKTGARRPKTDKNTRRP